jgi:hypothetical protein
VSDFAISTPYEMSFGGETNHHRHTGLAAADAVGQDFVEVAQRSYKCNILKIEPR